MNWEVKNIGDVCEVIAGQSPEGSYYNDKGDGMPFYQGKKEFNEKFIGEPTTWTTYITKVAEPGDILMSVRAPVGPVNFTSEQICIGRGLAAIRSRTVDKEFLFYSLLAKQDDISGRDGAVFPTINKKEIEAIQLSIPPLPEQQRIVAKLDAAFAALSEAEGHLQRNRANARELFESYLNGVFEGKGVSWKLQTVGDASERVSVGHVGTTSPYYRSEGVLFLTTQNVTKRGLSLDEVRFITEDFHNSLKKSQLKPGDVLMSRVITNSVNCGIIPSDIVPCNCANVVIVRPGSALRPEFLVYYIRSKSAQQYLLSKRVGSAQLVVNTGVVQAWPIPIPPRDEQNSLIKELDEMKEASDKLEATYQQKLTELEGLKKSLLGAAFRGEL